MIVKMKPQVWPRRHVLEPVHFGVMRCLIDRIVLAGGNYIAPILGPGMTVEGERVDDRRAIEKHYISARSKHKGN